MECETRVEVKWSFSTAWADAGESAYVKGFAQGEGCKHNFKQGPEGQAEVEKERKSQEGLQEKQERLKKTLKGRIQR
jgi:hypothetical protein